MSDLINGIRATERARAQFDAAVSKKKGSHAPKPRKRKKTHPNADQMSAMLKTLRRGMDTDPALEDFREDLFGELRKMIKPAIEQAKKGKPALLRILTRYGR